MHACKRESGCIIMYSLVHYVQLTKSVRAIINLDEGKPPCSEMTDGSFASIRHSNQVNI